MYTISCNIIYGVSQKAASLINRKLLLLLPKLTKHYFGLKLLHTGNNNLKLLAATLRWFTAGGAIRIAVRQLSQTWELRHYDVITRKL